MKTTKNLSAYYIAKLTSKVILIMAIWLSVAIFSDRFIITYLMFLGATKETSDILKAIFITIPSFFGLGFFVVHFVANDLDIKL